MPFGAVAEFGAVVGELTHRHVEETHRTSDPNVFDLC